MITFFLRLIRTLGKAATKPFKDLRYTCHSGILEHIHTTVLRLNVHYEGHFGYFHKAFRQRSIIINFVVEV